MVEMRLAHDCTTRKACTIGVYVTRMKQRKKSNYCPYMRSVYVLSRKNWMKNFEQHMVHYTNTTVSKDWIMDGFKRVNSKYSKQTLLLSLLSSTLFENSIEFTLQTFQTVYCSFFPSNSTRVNLLNINHRRVEQCVL